MCASLFFLFFFVHVGVLCVRTCHRVLLITLGFDMMHNNDITDMVQIVMLKVIPTAKNKLASKSCCLTQKCLLL